MKDDIKKGEDKSDNYKKLCLSKYFGLVLATLVGAFLAFYFVADMTIKHMMDPSYQMRKIDRLMQREDRMAVKMSQKMMKEIGIPMHRSFVLLEKRANEYKIIVDLKPFDNDPEDINVVVNDREVTVSGEVEKDQIGEDKFMRFSQTFYLEDRVDAKKMIKTEKNDKCIIILPIKK